MVILGLIAGAAFLALIFGPSWWVRRTMAAHGAERSDFPGTGGELARHLLDEAGLQAVKVEETSELGDHYDPVEKAVRLSPDNFHGRSVTAVAVAAHEVGHAVQDRDGYAPLRWRQALVVQAQKLQTIGVVVMMSAPLVFALLRAPGMLALQIVAALAIMASTLAVHAVTLPTEFDASFRRALPVLENYLPGEDLPAARKVLKAAAWTYVASALVSLLDVLRWFRILRF
ncbi:MAG: zinc metallopeptidase [Alphaproteobacteria bacterium]|nr:zinc metallopeptidase [Alphaproteobacteria bacterium]